MRAPDAAFATAARLSSIVVAPDGYFPAAPDLAVEVVSPSDTYSAVDEKVAEWLEAGCRVVVVLDPRRRAGTVHRPEGQMLPLAPTDRLTIPDLLPGWSVALTEIFD